MRAVERLPDSGNGTTEQSRCRRARIRLAFHERVASGRISEIGRHRLIFVLGVLLPVCIYAALVGYPIAYNVYLSFHSWDGLSSRVRYVGLGNYRDLIDDPTFWLSLANTVQWTVGAIVIADVFAFLLATALRSSKIYFGTMFRMLFFLPVTMSLVVIGLMFSFTLNPGFGALTQLVQLIGFQNAEPDVLGTPSTALYTLIVIFGWSYIGIPLMLFDAGLTQIPSELREAARLDGANGIQVLWCIVIPLMRPIFMVVTVFAVLEALRSFDLVLVMTRGGPASATQVLGYYMYDTAFNEQRFGYGAAISTVILVLSGLFAVFYVRRAARDALGGIP
jgi:ABC-type sugar transport system permease subunit